MTFGLTVRDFYDRKISILKLVASGGHGMGIPRELIRGESRRIISCADGKDRHEFNNV
jgi:hypothetical protein